jgi:hypothetical protein
VLQKLAMMHFVIAPISLFMVTQEVLLSIMRIQQVIYLQRFKSRATST